jgi:Domain of unknown function (DUF222)
MIDHQPRLDGKTGPAEAPWWLLDAFHGSDDAEEAAWLAGLPADVRAEYEAGPWTGGGESVAAGFLHHDHDGPAGAGFASGGVADAMPPGPPLARLASGATADGCSPLGESELIGVLCAWQRLTSWAQAGQAAAVIALADRRARQSRELDNPHLREHVGDEIAAALRLTGRSSGRLLDVASALSRLPEVLAALQAGQIDWAKACLFADLLAGLSGDDAQAIARKLLAQAGGMTTGQLRAALARAVLEVDPDAAEQRRKAARKDTEVQVWHEPSGNAALAGRELSQTDVIHASVRLTAFARWLQQHGATGTLDQLRSAVYIALLAGRTVQSLLAGGAESTGPRGGNPTDGSSDRTAPADGSPRRGNSAGCSKSASGGGLAGWFALSGSISAAAVTSAVGRSAEDLGWPQLTGSINLTMPMSAWLGLTGTPGEVAGHGPIDAATCRELAEMMNPAIRWCVTLTDRDGYAAAHACARRGPSPPGPGILDPPWAGAFGPAPGNFGPAPPPPPGLDGIAWASELRARLKFLETGDCGHSRESGRYQPPRSLCHLIRIRQRTCSYPGCRRAAKRCDLDHTTPFDEGGKSCECNLAPLCRRHHRAKQAPGWHLAQTEPGHMTWRLPHERTYRTIGEPYPV